jgi:hypothetical protein
MPKKQGYQHNVAHICLFVFIKVIKEYFSARLVFLKLKNLNITIMHASNDAFQGHLNLSFRETLNYYF